MVDTKQLLLCLQVYSESYMIPPKLVKIAGSVLCQSLSNALNNSLSKGISPDDAKIAMVSLLYKGTSNKTDISNFWPVSILKTFSKIYERLTKKLVDNGMDKYLSPFISVEILDMTINDNQLKSANQLNA